MPPTIIEIKELNREAQRDLSSLRPGPFAPVWGDALPADTTLWGTQPGGFGQTEVSGLAVLNGYGGRGLGNSGRPSPLVQVRVVDADGRECAGRAAGRDRHPRRPRACRLLEPSRSSTASGCATGGGTPPTSAAGSPTGPSTSSAR